MKHTLILLLLLPAIALGYSAGPPFGYTGAPGENNCTACHATNPLNSGNGSFAISGPASFEPGQTYLFTVTIQDPGQSRWGFELTPLGQGTITLAEPTRTQVQTAGNGNQYLRHTTQGTSAGTPNGPVSWTYNWTAPDPAPATVTFYAAGNAANNNGLNNGDFIYTTSLALARAQQAVNDLAITMLDQDAQLSWSAVPDATSYRVERRDDPSGAFLLLATVGTPGYLDSGAGAFGLYRVVALR